jgi:hypothetical protein
MTQAHSPSDSNIAGQPKTVAAGADAPPNKDLDALHLMGSHGDVLQTSNTSNTTDGWTNDGPFNVKTTRNNDGTATTVLARIDGIPVEVLDSAKDGSITQLFFGADGNPIGIHRTGAKPDPQIEFKTPDGKDYSIYGLSPLIDDPNPRDVRNPWMQIADSDGKTQTIKYNAGGAWQTFSVGPYTDNHRDLTNLQPAGGGTPYIARYSQNSDGGYNVQYLHLDGRTPMQGMESCRLMPVDQSSRVNTCMKPDGTVDYRDVLDLQTGHVTRYNPAGKVISP